MIEFPKISTTSTPTESMLKADNDQQAIELFYREKNENTRKAFRREITRFMFFLGSNDLGLKDVKHEHLLAYKQILIKPPAHLCGSKTTYTLPNGTDNPKWKPFVKGLSPKSVTTSLKLLSSFYSWLVFANYCKGNPFGLLSKHNPDSSDISNQNLKGGDVAIEKHFTTHEINAILFALSKLEIAQKKPFKIKRMIFAIIFLRRTGLRLAEFTHARLSNVSKVERTGRITWFLEGVGKGGKDYKIPLHDDCITSLKDYRLSMGQPTNPLLATKEQRLITSQSGNSLSTVQVHRIIKDAFMSVFKFYDDLKSDNPLQSNDLMDKLLIASAHWLRHTFITELSNLSDTPDIKTIQKLARHESINITSIYIHREYDKLEDIISRLD